MEKNSLNLSNHPLATSSPRSLNPVKEKAHELRNRYLEKLRKLENTVQRFPELTDIVYYSVEEEGANACGNFRSEVTRILTQNTASGNMLTTMEVPLTTKKIMAQNSSSADEQTYVVQPANEQTNVVQPTTTKRIRSRNKKTPFLPRVATVSSTKVITPLIKRLPLPGEQIISIRGSPISTGNSSHGTCQITLPLADGRTIAVSSGAALDASSLELPSVNKNTKNELKKLVKFGYKLLYSSESE